MTALYQNGARKITWIQNLLMVMLKPSQTLTATSSSKTLKNA